MADRISNASKVFYLGQWAAFVGNYYEQRPTDCRFRFPAAFNGTLEINAHQQLLATFGSVFARLFRYGNLKYAVSIEDASPAAFITFLEYFYRGSIELSARNIDELLYLAHKFEVGELIASCTEYITDNLCLANIIHFFTLAYRFTMHGLLLNCNRYYRENAEMVLKSAAFVQCNKEFVQFICQMARGACDEHILFDQCIEWAKNKCREHGINEQCPENLRRELDGSLRFIRFANMKRNELLQRITLYRLVFTVGEVQHINDIYAEMVAAEQEANNIVTTVADSTTEGNE